MATPVPTLNSGPKKTSTGGSLAGFTTYLNVSLRYSREPIVANQPSHLNSPTSISPSPKRILNVIRRTSRQRTIIHSKVVL